jgi:hypothetical protein
MVEFTIKVYDIYSLGNLHINHERTDGKKGLHKPI